MKTLLVVNDSEVERAAVAQFFREHGFRVVEAASSEDGIATVVNQPIHFVIMKTQMPRLSGIDTAPIIKRIRPQVHVFLTAPRNFHEPEETSRQVDFFTCFEEPVDLEHVKAVIEST